MCVTKGLICLVMTDGPVLSPGSGQACPQSVNVRGYFVCLVCFCFCVFFWGGGGGRRPYNYLRCLISLSRG